MLLVPPVVLLLLVLLVLLVPPVVFGMRTVPFPFVLIRPVVVPVVAMVLVWHDELVLLEILVVLVLLVVLIRPVVPVREDATMQSRHRPYPSFARNHCSFETTYRGCGQYAICGRD